eukprot:3515980-Amphidinium_carterae.2
MGSTSPDTFLTSVRYQMSGRRAGLQADVQDRYVEGIEVGSVSRHYAAFAHTQGPKDALRMAAAAWASALYPTQPSAVEAQTRRGRPYLVQRFAQEAGHTALAAQFALIATTLSHDQEAASSTTRRGHERTDLHLVSPGGQDQYIDIRVTAVPYAADVHLHLSIKRDRSDPSTIELTFERARRSLHDDTTWAAQLASARLYLQPLSILLLRNTAVAEGTCLGDARLTADMQLNARHNVGARGNVAPTLATSSAAPLTICTPATALDSLEGTTQIDPPATICASPVGHSNTVPEPAAASASSPQPC